MFLRRFRALIPVVALGLSLAHAMPASATAEPVIGDPVCNTTWCVTADENGTTCIVVKSTRIECSDTTTVCAYGSRLCFTYEPGAGCDVKYQNVCVDGLFENLSWLEDQIRDAGGTVAGLVPDEVCTPTPVPICVSS